MELSANGAGGGGGGMDGARPTSQLAFPPQQAWPNQQPPVTLARRRSNEHLIQQQGPASPTGSSPHPPSTIAAHPGAMAQQQRGTPSPFHFQQQQQNVPQQPQQQQQFGQQRPQAQPRSIMRPPSSQASGPYGGGPYGMAPQAQNRQYPIQYATGPGQQYQQKAFQQPQQHSPRSQSQPPPQHLSDVFQSREDVELAENMRSFFASKVPAPIWLSLSVVQIIAGIVSLFYGALNASPYNCRVEPNIPIFLIISGILLIVNGGIRLFFFLTSSSNAKRKMVRRAPGGNVSQQRKKGTPMKHLCEYALEGTVLFAIVVVVILGCVWVYGAQRFMHNQNYMFENHYCHYTLYWTAWWSVTLHLGFFALLILGAIILLIYGALLG